MTHADLRQSIRDVSPWAPGLSRDERFVALELPAGVPTGVRVDVLDESSAALRIGGGLRIDVTPDRGRAKLMVRVPTSDAVVLWRLGSDQDRAHVPPSWSDEIALTPFTGVCLGSLVARSDRPIVTFAAGAGDRPVLMRAGMIEETAEFLLVVEADAPLSLHLTFGGDLAAELVAVGRALDFAREQVSGAHEDPVYCTWYGFHQDLDADRLLAEARIASDLGFGTVIVDDGWQNTDTDRGYGSCGDWAVEPAKLPDAAGVVSALDALGLRTVWWIGTPFIGHRSAAYASGALAALYDEPAMDAAVLDPRSVATRAHLVGRLRALLAETGAAGLKIDFLERFARSGADVPADADCADSEDGALRLLDEIGTAIAEVRGDALIEFREPYVTPATIGRATMFRVGDCPLSPVRNRQGVIDMRLATRGVAVHADPIMWSAGDSPERVAQQLHASLFGVPQVSVLLAAQTERQLATLRHWLAFWRAHRALLLHGDLDVTGVHRSYETATAAAGGVAVTARYGGAGVTVPVGDWHTWHIVDADEGGVVVSGGVGAYDVTVRDCAGEQVAVLAGVDLSLAALPVPAGGYAEVTQVG